MKSKTFTKILAPTLALSMLFSSSAFAEAATEATETAAAEAEILTKDEHKIRTIITTDGEIDDQCSLVHYMLYSNMFELEGLVSSSSKFHYETKEGEVFKGRESNQQWIDAYAEVYDNLCLHDDDFPTPEYLTSINVEGNISEPGEMDTDTEGSLLIKECIMDDRDDLLFLQVWGGTNTIAAALRSIEEEYKDTDQWEDVYNKVCSKVQIWIDLDQDDTLNDYILPNWPDIPIIVSYNQFWAFGYPWESLIPEEYQQYFEEDFMVEYIANDSNPLAEIYYNNLLSPEAEATGHTDLSFLSEGDTPNFFYILDNGLRSYEDPSYGGWAGRFEKVVPSLSGEGIYTNGTLLGGLWSEASDDGDLYKPLYRWIDDFQNEFAARMEWCTASYEEANHEPVIQIEEGIDLTAAKGETITLTPQTYDPDGDTITVTSWQYGDADTYGGDVEITEGENGQISFVVPDDAKIGDTIHIIFEAQDDYELPITRYQRVIVTVADDASAEEATE